MDIHGNWLSIGLIFTVTSIMLASQWRIYSKAGEAGWKGFIPVYNLVVMLKIAGKPTIWVLYYLIPIVGLIYIFKMTYALCRSFGQGLGFTIGVFLMPMLFIPILGLGPAKYIGPQN